MLVIERGLFIIGRKPSPCSKFGGRIQNPGISQKARYRIAVKSDLPVSSYLLKKIFELYELSEEEQKTIGYVEIK